MKCSNCGTDNRTGVTQCVACGAPMVAHNDPFQVPETFAPPPIATNSSKSRTTAAILALILGSLGVHKFYLEQTGAGILYLLFSWTLIPGLLGLIDAIKLFTMSDQEFASKYP